MEITRVIRNNKFQYLDRTKKVIKNRNQLNRFKSLKIPPAYTNVKISAYKDTAIQAIGQDNLNRKQYIYHQDFIEEQKEVKFSDLILFGRKLKRIRKDVNNNLKNIQNNLSKEKIISIIIFLIDKCHFRIGTEKYKKLYNTYGVSTLSPNHLIFNKNNLVIQFIGKKGVLNKSKISNGHAIDYLKQLCQYNSDKEYIFYYQDNINLHHITHTQINNFLQKYNRHISAKFFRTWCANHTMLGELVVLPKLENIKDRQKEVRRIIKVVASKLNNTPQVSKSNYIYDQLIELYLNNYQTFLVILDKSKKYNNTLPTIDRLLTIFLIYFKNN